MESVRILSDAEIAAAAKAGGFTGEEIAIATAIALAETHPKGNTFSHNAVPPDDSYGLMQINMIGSMGPERRKRFGLKSNADLYDPTTNMRVAKALKDGRGNWHDWSTYTQGKYLLYLARARKAAGSPAGSVPGIGSGAATQVGVVSGTVDFVEFITDASTWKRLGFILAGATLILVSLAMMGGAPGKVANIVPVGRLAKAATAVKAA